MNAATEGYTQSAFEKSCSAVNAPGVASVGMPADLAAANDVSLSSIARHSFAERPRRFRTSS